RTILLAAASLGGTHCATSGNVGELRTRAAFDLACPGESLQVQPLAERTYGVEGCGRRGTYVWAYQNQSWLLDSRSGGGALSEASTAPAALAAPASSVPASSAPASGAPATNAGSTPAPVAAPPTAATASKPPSAPSGPTPDAKACEAAQDYRRRAA